MNKRLTLTACGVLLFVITLSMISNTLTTTVVQDSFNMPQEIKQPFESIQWKGVLLGVSQFNNETSAPQKSVEDKVSIIDSTIIAIIADKPQSVVLMTKSDDKNAIQLFIGESWLNHWVLDQINPDSVTWKNIVNQELKTQYLFAQPDESLDK